MKDWVALVPLVLGSMGTFGLLLVLFCGGAVIAESHGALLPNLINEWARAGFLLGLILLLLRILSFISAAANRTWSGHNDKRRERASVLKGQSEGVANLQTLTREEAEFLLSLLRQAGQTRFHVDANRSPAASLVSKHILKIKTEVSWHAWRDREE
jgi:hypothetical protein